ncbi:VWA domain-containing protein [Granulicella mallensis]|uniref:VWFA-related protein n=1 Tax=Granulicella mallensis TaxID=940614 RepID=A0A7W7ZSM3_9BACT|nr:VWA domain-containing protein [Granulicella mallensis]MBB5065022.1 VWFA-related protein [Granulicella mallensis]
MRYRIASLLSLGISLGLQAQTADQNQPVNQNQLPAPTLQVQSQLVLVPTTVETGKGDMVYGLKASQFLTKDNGVHQDVQLEDAGNDARPLSLVVVVQCSRSAEREFPKLRGVATMVSALVGGAPTDTAVVQFGTGEELLSGFTRDPAARERALNRLAPCSDDEDTIFDAVDYANTLLDSRKTPGRRVILLISETRDHGSETKPMDVIRALGRTNTVVDTVSFSPAKSQLIDEGEHGPPPGATTNWLALVVMAVEAARTNAPKEFAGLSGGEYINFTTQHGFDRSLNTLANHVHNYYLLSFVPRFPADASGSSAASPGLHSLSVKIPDYPSATVRHRESYWANDIEPAK